MTTRIVPSMRVLDERVPRPGPMHEDVVRLGVISDTHGLLRPEALVALQGSDQIIHAGDLGAPEILARLRDIAPTVAVRGNVDTAPWATALPLHDVVSVGDVQVYVTHGHHALDFDPAAAGFAAVVSGHSHRPAIEHRGGVLFLNPGSAGPRRFPLPVTVASLVVRGTEVHAEIITLPV